MIRNRSKIDQDYSRGLLKSKTVRSIENSNSFVFHYLWGSSIPDSWNRIINKNKIVKLKILKNNRNTLKFLEETQKYIRKICNPNESKEVEIIPNSGKSNENIKKLLIRKSQTDIYEHKKITLINKKFQRNSQYFSKNIIKDTKPEPISSNSPLYKNNFSHDYNLIIKSRKALINKL